MTKKVIHLSDKPFGTGSLSFRGGIWKLKQQNTVIIIHRIFKLSKWPWLLCTLELITWRSCTKIKHSEPALAYALVGESPTTSLEFPFCCPNYRRRQQNVWFTRKRVVRQTVDLIFLILLTFCLLYSHAQHKRVEDNAQSTKATARRSA